jgi:hypothetical protein
MNGTLFSLLALAVPAVTTIRSPAYRVEPSAAVSRGIRVAAGPTVARPVANSAPDVISVKAFGAIGDGVVDDTTAIQAAIDACPTNGTVTGSPGTYLTDTLTAKSNCTLDLRGMTLSFKGHSTSHHPVIRVGTQASASTKVRILGGIINGNRASQTFPREEWSPGIMIWGSDYNTIEGVEIANTAGDGITIGFDAQRLVGSNGNHVTDCDIHDVLTFRQAIAITWGSENVIARNRITGTIDLELNANQGECKNNIVSENQGRTQRVGLTAPRTSDLQILLASLNTDTTRYSGNRVIGNSCQYIGLQYNKGTIISGNHVVGSTTSQARLMAIDGSDDTIVTGNTLVANTAAAKSLAEVIRTRGSANLTVTGNNVANESKPFHSYSPQFGASNARNHVFRDNVLTGTGAYRNGDAERASEWALFRLDVVTGRKTVTQVAGVPVTTGNVGSSANDIVLSSFGSAGTKFQIHVWPTCSVTTAAAATLDGVCLAKSVASGSNRTLTIFGAPAAAGPLALTEFHGSSGSGTFYFDVYF